MKTPDFQPAVETLETRRLLAAGDVDGSFARVAQSLALPRTDLLNPQAIDVAYDIDGSVVMLASVDRNGTTLPALMRVGPDGQLATWFGQGGVVVLELGLAVHDAEAIAIDGGGRINVLATVETSVSAAPMAFVTQLTRQGRLNTRFGQGGNTFPKFGATSNAADITVDPSNRIYILDETGAVARLSANGRAEWFGLTRVVRTLAGAGATGIGESIQTFGTSVLVGVTINTRKGSTDFAVVKLTESGAYDRSFGRRGFASVDIAQGSGDQLDALYVDHSNRIVLSGKRSFSLSGADDVNAIVALARLTPAGALDTRFFKTGIADGVKIGASRPSGFYSYTTRFEAAPVLLAQQGDVYRLYTHDAEMELTLSGREWSQATSIPSEESPRTRTGHFGIASRGDDIVTAFTNAQFPDTYVTIGRDSWSAMLVRHASNPADHYSAGLPLVNSVEGPGVGADGRVAFVTVPATPSTDRTLLRYNADGTPASRSVLTGRDGWSHAEPDGLFEPVNLPRNDGGSDLIYRFRDVSDGDSGAFANYVVDPNGTATPAGSTQDEVSRVYLARLPLGHLTYSSTTFPGVVATLQRPGSNPGFTVTGSNDEPGVLPAAPLYIVPIIGSSDVFVLCDRPEGSDFIVRLSSPTTISTAFAPGFAGILPTINIRPVLGQADGRLLHTTEDGYGLSRLNVDASPDNTFGTGGGVMGGDFDHFDVDSKGRIVAWRVLNGGAADGDIQIARFSQNGKVDTTFGGGDGIMIVDARLPSTATPNVIIDAQDRLVVTAFRQSATAISWSATRILGD